MKKSVKVGKELKVSGSVSCTPGEPRLYLFVRPGAELRYYVTPDTGLAVGADGSWSTSTQLGSSDRKYWKDDLKYPSYRLYALLLDRAGVDKMAPSIKREPDGSTWVISLPRAVDRAQFDATIVQR